MSARWSTRIRRTRSRWPRPASRSGRSATPRTISCPPTCPASPGSAPALFLFNHGIVTVGPDLQTATVAAILLERACAQQMLTHAFGGWPTWSDPEESLSKRRNIYAEGPVRAVWEYLVRSLG